MKAPNRIARRVLLVVSTVLGLSACLGIFDDSGLDPVLYIHDCRATIQAADGTRSEVSTDAITPFNGTPFAPLMVEDDGVYAPEDMRRKWMKYLKRVLDGRSGEEWFTSVYGRGPWCVVGGPVITRTEERVDWRDGRIVQEEEGDELPICACGESCGNPPGVTPVLELTPAPASPYVVDFGAVPVGTPSSLEVTLANAGAGRLCLNPPAVHESSENPEDFDVVPLAGCDAGPDGTLVLESTTCRFRATFTPTRSGVRTARVPRERGCGEYITLTGTGTGGTLTASPAPACFPAPAPCSEVPIRIDNASAAAVTLTSASVTDSAPDRWFLAGMTSGDGTPIDLTAAPYALGPGSFVTARVQLCSAAVGESALRVVHNGADYGATGSPTGDVDAGSPLTVRLLPPPCAP